MKLCTRYIFVINNLFQYIYFAIGRSGGSGNFMGRGGNYGGGSGGGGGGGSYSRGKYVCISIVVPLIGISSRFVQYAPLVIPVDHNTVG